MKKRVAFYRSVSKTRVLFGVKAQGHVGTQHKHMIIPRERALAPIVIPIAKSMYGIGTMISSEKMVSF